MIKRFLKSVSKLSWQICFQNKTDRSYNTVLYNLLVCWLSVVWFPRDINKQLSFKVTQWEGEVNCSLASPFATSSAAKIVWQQRKFFVYTSRLYLLIQQRPTCRSVKPASPVCTRMYPAFRMKRPVDNSIYGTKHQLTSQITTDTTKVGTARLLSGFFTCQNTQCSSTSI